MILTIAMAASPESSGGGVDVQLLDMEIEGDNRRTVVW